MDPLISRHLIPGWSLGFQFASVCFLDDLFMLCFAIFFKSSFKSHDCIKKRPKVFNLKRKPTPQSLQAIASRTGDGNTPQLLQARASRTGDGNIPQSLQARASRTGDGNISQALLTRGSRTGDGNIPQSAPLGPSKTCPRNPQRAPETPKKAQNHPQNSSSIIQKNV